MITGIEKLNTALSSEQIEQLNKAADRHTTQSNISFTLLAVEDNLIEIETAQGKNKSGKYATEATLIKRTQEVFSNITEFQLKVHPHTYLPSPTSVVNTA
ncbi:hypothetical protein ABDJ41_18575 [Pedobacter sp. ASV1-7]|uniref:hypothetical protein n=1 Tax=Pedobacter sp. ASV1-7 TaxID=3145237 RepID=UPI0032E8C5E4